MSRLLKSLREKKVITSDLAEEHLNEYRRYIHNKKTKKLRTENKMFEKKTGDRSTASQDFA